MSERFSACPLDCPDACSVNVTVEGGRVRALRAHTGNPDTAGFLCAKVARFTDSLDGEHRVRTPLLRDGPKGSGRFRATGWDEAMEVLEARLRPLLADGRGEAILPLSYGGSNGALSHGVMDERFFRRAGASRLQRTVCAAANGRAVELLYGRMPGVPFDHYERAELIVVWGCNPHATSIHLVPILKRARAAGARLVVVDPRQTPLAREADLHLAPRPGGDLAIALALIGEAHRGGRADRAFLEQHTEGHEELFARAEPWTMEAAAERASVPVEELRRFASLYADAAPAVIRLGWGVERNRLGGSASAAILALPAVYGQFGVPGGGYTLSNSSAWPVDREPAIATPAVATRSVNMNRLGRALLEAEPRIELLFVHCANPLSTLPRQDLVRRGLERPDLFTVVHEQQMTDTARWADLVLPATTFLEHADLPRGYGSRVAHRVEAVIPPIGEARSNVRLFSELIRRLGLEREGDVTDERALLDRLVATLPPEHHEALSKPGTARLPVEGHAVQMKELWPSTPRKRVRLWHPSFDSETPAGLYREPAVEADPRHPLALLSPALARQISATFGERSTELLALSLHPQDAEERGLDDGAIVRVFNEHGEVHVPLRMDATLRRGVASLPKGMWFHHALNGSTGNALCPDHLTDLGEGACFNDARVEVSALPAAQS